MVIGVRLTTAATPLVWAAATMGSMTSEAASAAMAIASLRVPITPNISPLLLRSDLSCDLRVAFYYKRARMRNRCGKTMTAPSERRQFCAINNGKSVVCRNRSSNRYSRRRAF
ncbi:hypothetical protein D3C87_1603230 [compost metagenome]